jgi:phage tail-like protein
MAQAGVGGRLLVQLQGNLVQTLELTAALISIGRTPDNGLSLPHPMVSRHHAELRLAPEGPVLTDMGSTHGTWVGDVRLLQHQPRVLAHGDVIRIEPFVITYLSAAPSASSGDDAADPVAALPSTPVSDPISIAPVAVVALQPERPVLPAVVQPPGRSSYVFDLPIIYHDNDFLGRFLQIFETIWKPLEDRQSHIEMYFDPLTCPAEFLPWLAGWLDLSYNRHWPEARVRRLVADGMDLYRWRGTRYGLARMIEIHTGVTPEVREDPAQPFVFHVRLAGNGEKVDRQLVAGIIEQHKPAHTGYTLEITS